MLSSLLVGFGLSRINWPGRNAVFGMLIATLMLPGVVTIIPLYIIFRYAQLVGTFYPLWLPAWFGYAFYIFLMRQYMMTLPRELDEAARMDGAANFRILWQIITPLCSPAIATIAIFAFLQHYNDFLGPLLYISANEMFTPAAGPALVPGPLRQLLAPGHGGLGHDHRAGTGTILRGPEALCAGHSADRPGRTVKVGARVHI